MIMNDYLRMFMQEHMISNLEHAKLKHSNFAIKILNNDLS